MNKNRFLSNPRYLYALIVLGIVVLIILNFWGLFFLHQLEKQILEQLKIQINQIGMVSAKLIDGSEIENLYPGAETSPPALYYQQLLWEIKRSGNLQDIFVASLDKSLLIHYQVNYEIGGKILFPINDSLFTAATRGKTPQPEFLVMGDQYFLTSYTPILDDLGDVAGVLIIEAPARFFSTLYRFKKGLFTLGIGGMLIILLFSLLIVLAVRQILKVERQLQEQNRLAHLGQMAAMVAHEIRNPLSIIKGSADVLKKKYAHTDDELFEFIPEEIERLNRLVNDFLQFARRRQLNLQSIDPNAVVESVVRQFNDPRIQLNLTAEDIRLQLDADAFKQILINLIENARQAIDQNGTIQIESRRTRSRHPGWEIIIRDNGKGMDEETLSKIFNPFYSTRAAGSGLGMTITKQLVEQMKGNIKVHSQPNQGTTVSIYFPL